MLTDERILGSGEFAEKVLKEANETLKYHYDANKRRQKVQHIVEQKCKEEKINPLELRAGSHRGRIPEIRSQIVYQLVEEFGIPLAEIARHVGVSTSAISKALKKGKW